MSESNEGVEDEIVSGDAIDGPSEAEARARRMGWRSKEEFKGDPSAWSDAETFLQRGMESPEILRDRYRMLDSRTARMEQDLAATREQLDRSASVVSEMSERLRSADERAMARARRELEEQRDQAVEQGDRGEVRRIQQEIDELRAQVTAAPAAAVVAPQQVAPTTPPVEVQQFFRENPWYLQRADLQGEADALHIAISKSRPDLPLAENLREVRRRMALMHPDTVQDGSVRAEQRRQAAPGDGGGSERAPPRQVRSRRSFDGMPADAKDQYKRWNEMLAGKGKPLTKEEFAADYWDQFPEDGA